MPALRLALENMNIPSRYRHVERERTAGRGLAVGAVASVEQQRKRRDLVADRAAGAAAVQRKDGSHVHGQAWPQVMPHPIGKAATWRLHSGSMARLRRGQTA